MHTDFFLSTFSNAYRSIDRILSLAALVSCQVANVSEKNPCSELREVAMGQFMQEAYALPYQACNNTSGSLHNTQRSGFVSIIEL